jgi:hypothetical protein
VTGIVSDDDGSTVAGATVTFQSNPIGGSEPVTTAAQTDSSGRYALTFVGVASTANLAVVHDGYERSSVGIVLPVAGTVTANIVLRRILRIAAGDALAVSVDGKTLCGLEDEWICRTVRVAVTTAGASTLTLQVTAAGLQPAVGVASPAHPTVVLPYPCCGTQVQTAVSGGDELIVDVMLPWTSHTGVVTLRTSLQ